MTGERVATGVVAVAAYARGEPVRVRVAQRLDRVARMVGAELGWEDDVAWLAIGSDHGEPAARSAWAAAAELWLSLRLELQVPARIAVHVVSGGLPDGQSQARALLAATEPSTVRATEELALALEEASRRDLAALPAGTDDGAAVYVYPRRLGTESVHGAPTDLWRVARGAALDAGFGRLRLPRLRGLGEPPPLDLDDVFVVPDLEERVLLAAPDPRTRGLGRPREVTRRVSIAEAMRFHRRLAVVGDPGQGKSSLLRWLARVAARGPVSLFDALGSWERLLPVYASVAELAAIWVGEPSLSMPAVLARGSAGGGMRGLEQELEHQLTRGRCLLLLDGLDEVATEHRAAVGAKLSELVDRYPDNRVVLSARRAGYVGAPIRGATELGLSPLTRPQRDRLAAGLVRAHLSGRSRDDDETVARAVEDVTAAIDASDRVEALAGNPMLLGILVVAHRAEHRLPRHRAQVYDLVARAMCESWPIERRTAATAGSGRDEGELVYDDVLPLLGALAVRLFEEHPSGVAPEAFVVDVLARSLAEHAALADPAQAEAAARDFLRRQMEEPQLLCEVAPGSWAFLHRTFLELFVAVGLHAQECFEREALRHLFDPLWQEVLALGVGYLALVQKRALKTRQLVERALATCAEGDHAFVTELLGLEVPAAARMTAEAGDVVPVAVREHVMARMLEWVLRLPSDVTGASLRALRGTEIGHHLGQRLCEQLTDGASPGRVAGALAALQHRAAVPVLTSLVLRVEHGGALEDIADALVDLGAFEAVPAIRSRIEVEPMTAFDLGRALRRLSPAAADDLLRRLDAIRRAERVMMRLLGPKVRERIGLADYEGGPEDSLLASELTRLVLDGTLSALTAPKPTEDEAREFAIGDGDGPSPEWLSWRWRQLAFLELDAVDPWLRARAARGELLAWLALAARGHLDAARPLLAAYPSLPRDANEALPGDATQEDVLWALWVLSMVRPPAPRLVTS
ncbi:MAG: hypothetical protein IT379_32770 [Deltaproteobacteria bacterium]|nr:hypothetical protein [Deltaproteobacteria bacterium]